VEAEKGRIAMTDAPTITVITDRDIAELCANIYTAQSPGEWEQLELPPDGIAFGIKDLGPATALIFRGTKSPHQMTYCKNGLYQGALIVRVRVTTIRRSLNE
jgi:hypothetical protein